MSANGNGWSMQIEGYTPAVTNLPENWHVHQRSTPYLNGAGSMDFPVDPDENFGGLYD